MAREEIPRQDGLTHHALSDRFVETVERGEQWSIAKTTTSTSLM